MAAIFFWEMAQAVEPGLWETPSRIAPFHIAARNEPGPTRLAGRGREGWLGLLAYWSGIAKLLWGPLLANHRSMVTGQATHCFDLSQPTLPLILMLASAPPAPIAKLRRLMSTLQLGQR